jgi:hypothetical protein
MHVESVYPSKAGVRKFCLLAHPTKIVALMKSFFKCHFTFPGASVKVTFVYTAINLRGFAAVSICHARGHVCTSVSILHLTSHASASKDGPGVPVSHETFFFIPASCTHS